MLACLVLAGLRPSTRLYMYEPWGARGRSFTLSPAEIIVQHYAREAGSPFLLCSCVSACRVPSGVFEHAGAGTEQLLERLLILESSLLAERLSQGSRVKISCYPRVPVGCDSRFSTGW